MYLKTLEQTNQELRNDVWFNVLSGIIVDVDVLGTRKSTSD